MELDSIITFKSVPPRFCIFSFFKISLDSVNVAESIWLDSISCASFRISALDSVNVLDSESVLDSVDSMLPRFCFCLLFRISLDSALPRFCARESVRNCTDSMPFRFCIFLFFGLAFSRIFSRFLESCVSQKKKGFIPSPLAKAPKKIKRRVFAAAWLATRWLFFGSHKVYLLAGVPRSFLV